MFKYDFGTIYFVHVQVNASINFLFVAGNPLMKLNQAFRWLTSSVNPSTSTMQVQVTFNLRLCLPSEHLVGVKFDVVGWLRRHI